MNVDQAAFYTVSTLALATIAFTAGAILAQGTAATVAYAILTALGSALSIASVSAWASLKGRAVADSSDEYFDKFFSHVGYGISGVSQFFAQGIVLAAFTGVTQGITAGTSFAISQSITSSLLKK